MSDLEKKPERYNTQFLVSNIQSEQKKLRVVGITVGAIIAIAVIYFLFIHTPAPESIQAPAQTPVVVPSVPPTPAQPPTAVPPPK